MQEAFLHFVWQFQYFNKKDLLSLTGELIDVRKPGLLNLHAGPDFSDSSIRIGGMQWSGSTEIHVKSSFWIDHRHDRDPAYDNVILHVVWENDLDVIRADGSPLPTLELKNRVDHSLLADYHRLVRAPHAIACQKSFPGVPDMVKRSMVEKMLIGRLQRKSAEIENLLQQCRGDWQETAFQVLVRSYGFKLNADPFSQLARAVPYRLLRKHAGHPQQVEALLFGQAGLLEEEAGDSYYQVLRREYRLLAAKYDLASTRLKKSQWKFLRLRPANFPTRRLAELAAMLGSCENVFARIFDDDGLSFFRTALSVSPAGYWTEHYQFNRTAKSRMSGIGTAGVDHLIVNAVVPLLVAYARHTDSPIVMERSLRLLGEIPGESNSIIRQWDELGFRSASAADSQALIELYNQYCQQRKCLSCNIGAFLLKPKPA